MRTFTQSWCWTCKYCDSLIRAKASLHILPPTSNIVTQQNFVVASWKNFVEKSRHQFNLLQLATTKFCCVTMFEVVVIRATTFFNLQCNNVALQVAAICCSYYFTFTDPRRDPWSLRPNFSRTFLGRFEEKETRVRYVLGN